MSTDLTTWALPRLERLLPLDQDSLKEVISYSDSLPKDGAAEHLQNLLGGSAQSLEFISSFNSRRKNAPQSNAPSAPTSQPVSRQASPPEDGVPRAKPKQAKKKQNIHALPARQIEDHGAGSQVYQRKDELDYMAASKPKIKQPPLSSKPEIAPQGPKVVDTAGTAGLLHPSADTSNLLTTPSPGSSSPSPSPARTPATSSRPASPAPAKSSAKPTQKTTVKISGGKAMHGASSTLSDLDHAIRSLELQTNPTLSSTSNPEADRERQCNCMATIHPLLTAAPNCLSCGKIICLKQGLGPCTSCSTPLLSSSEISSLLRVLKDERGKERQTESNKAHKRAEVATKPRPFSGRDFLSSTTASRSASGASTPMSAGSRDASPTPAELLASSSAAPSKGPETEKERAAREHRDKLLSFQSQNARRTQIHDEAADFALPTVGGDGTLRGNVWASPAERALELKKQQRQLREMEFNARPEWQRKRQVAALEIGGDGRGRVVRRFVERKFEDEAGQKGVEEVPADGSGGNEERADGVGIKGAFGNNPLLGKMIRPVYKAEGSGGEAARDVESREQRQRKAWRRVQDDLDDNEDVILDGGAKGFGFDNDIRVN